MTFRHFIITRFNVNIHPVEDAFRLGETWLTQRFELFCKFCFPSVRHQESQDFTWLVLFDEQTPARFKRIVGSFERYPNFVPVFCGDYASVLPRVREHIVRIQPDADWYLTTRLDNDDALSARFVRTLHKVVEGLLASPESVSEVFINFPHGLQYCEGVVYDFDDVTNAFVSLLERNTPPHTVFWVDHPDIYKKAPVAQIETRPIFLQNVHGQNVYNYIRGTVNEEKGVLGEFNLDL
jgi:hypothetical protein